MTSTFINSRVAALRRAWAALHLHWRALVVTARGQRSGEHEPHRLHLALGALGLRRRLVRRCAIASALLICAVVIPIVALSWRLSSGPLSVDLVTPWLTSAIEERFGGRHRVEVGGTQLERTEEGRTALRLRDIVVRDLDGTVVASAPKAEVGFSGLSLLTGHIQAERLSLIGVTMAVRIETNGEVTVSAGSDRRPIATAPGPAVAPPGARSAAAGAPGPSMIAAALAWLTDLDALGLDGRDLTEIGLKNGSLVVDDRRGGKQWSFQNINLSLARPHEGGVAFAINSVGADGPWSVTATVTPRGNGRRAIEAVVRDLSPNDVLLALRVGDGRIKADMPISGILRAEIGPDGTPQSAEGRILVKAGYILDPDNTDGRVIIDDAQVNFRWDPVARQLAIPIDVTSGGTRVTLLGQLDAPAQPGGAWGLAISRGLIVLAPSEASNEPPLVLDRVAINGRFDPLKRRIEVDHGDVSGLSTDIAFSGVIDYAGDEPKLTAGLAATKMTASAMKRMWPVFIQSQLRRWVVEHVLGGTVDRVVMAINAPLNILRGTPAPEEAVSVDVSGSAGVIRPVDTLPPIHDADLIVHATGRTVTVRMSRGVGELPSGRKVTLSNGLFEGLDTHMKPVPARVRFRLEAPVDAAAELLTMDPLHDASGVQLDPAVSHGNVAAQVVITWPLMDHIPKSAVAYTVEGDIANFAADRLVRGQKVEAAALRLNASAQGIEVKGDMRIGGVAASVDYRKLNTANDAEVRAQAIFDEPARARLGFDWNGSVTGSVPVKLNGRIGPGERDSRFAVEADLTQAKVADFLPGWAKSAGKPTRATFVMLEKVQGTRFEDIVIDGSGTQIKGLAEVDVGGNVTLANFATFAPSDGDKATLKAERASDGTLKVTMRGEVYDGRNFIHAALGGPSGEKTKQAMPDLDLDIKIGAVAGFNGETLRGVELNFARRAGQVRSFGLSAKLGRDAALLGDLRGYTGGRQVVYLETNDAGALMRFTDIYPKIIGGQMWVAMDPPATNRASQDGLLNVRDFAVRNEPVLERVAMSGPVAEQGVRMPAGLGNGVAFSRMRLDFVRAPGKLAIRDGVMWGPAVGATIEGQMDYGRDEVRMRGTFVPAYALNNIIPRMLPFIAPQNEGLFAVTYEVVGQLHAPTLRVNPMSGIAPGFLRKFFEFQGDGQDRTFSTPNQFR